MRKNCSKIEHTHENYFMQLSLSLLFYIDVVGSLWTKLIIIR